MQCNKSGKRDLSTDNSISFALPQRIPIFLERTSDQLSLLPQVRRQETVGVGNGTEGRLQRVLQGLG
jgi:hypothetical protein